MNHSMMAIFSVLPSPSPLLAVVDEPVGTKEVFIREFVYSF